MVQYANFDGAEGTVVVSGYKGVGEDRHRSVSFWIRTTQKELATICYWGHALRTNPARFKEKVGIELPNIVVSGFPDGSESRVRMVGGYIELFGKGSRRRSRVKVNDGNFHHIVCTWFQDDAAPGHEDFQVGNIIVDSFIENGKGFGPGNLPTFPDGTVHTSTAINTPEDALVVIGARPVTTTGLVNPDPLLNPSVSYTEHFQGDLDEFAVYNDVMSSGTILGAYNGGVRGADLLSLDQVPALQFWYRMGDDPDDVVPSGTLPLGTFFDQNPFTLRHGVVSSGVTIS